MYFLFKIYLSQGILRWIDIYEVRARLNFESKSISLVFIPNEEICFSRNLKETTFFYFCKEDFSLFLTFIFSALIFCFLYIRFVIRITHKFHLIR